MQDKRDVKAMRAGKKALTEAWEQLGSRMHLLPRMRKGGKEAMEDPFGKDGRILFWR